MFTTPMVQLFAVVLRKDCESVTEALLSEGAMQFIDVSELEGESASALSDMTPQASPSDISDLRKRIEGFLTSGGVTLAPPEQIHIEQRAPVDVMEEKAHLERVTREHESIRERQRTIHQEILKLEDIRRQVEQYGLSLSDVMLPTKHSFVSMQIGKVPISKVPKLESAIKELPTLNIEMQREKDSSHQLLISMKKDAEQVERILADAGWSKIELPDEVQSVQKDVFRELSTKLKDLSQEQQQLATKAKEIIKKEEGRLREIWTNLRVNELLCRIQSNFKSSARTAVFTGWVPASKKQSLDRRIRAACENRCYLEWNTAESGQTMGDEPPVDFKNPKALEPFQMLVTNFGVPKYGTIDPTPFVMPLYLCMFGLMFADVGQGLVLTLLGVLGAKLWRNNPDKQGLYQLSWLMVWCGSSSVVFGVLFGSYFGIGLLPPLWFDYHGIISGHPSQSSLVTDVFDILRITLYFGIFVISLGLLFNWINLIRSRQWTTLIFDKGGVLGGWIYAGGIYMAGYMVSTSYKEFPPGPVLFMIVGLPSLLMGLKEPLHYFEHNKMQPFDIGGLLLALPKMLMDWVIELLEIFSGYLSNTLSFMRVAGLGIAHVCLMISFFQLADMTSGVFAFLILVFGNVLVIGLEGLSAGIQALRLNYYEFFTKFFHGTGKLYSPISLSSTS